MDEDERQEMEDALAEAPKTGDVIPGMGGVRKLRVPLPGRGKRGGARLIYYFWEGEILLLLLHLYAKNEREDLAPDEKKAAVKLVEQFKKEYGHG